MSYYYDIDAQYGDEYSNHGNDEYDEYSDYAEPDHDPDSTSNYEEEYEDADAQYGNNADCEENGTNADWEIDDNGYECEDDENERQEEHEYETEGMGHEEGQIYRDEEGVYNHGGYEHEGEYTDNKCDDDKDQYEVIHADHNPPTSQYIHPTPYASPITSNNGHDDDDDVCEFAPADHSAVEHDASNSTPTYPRCHTQEPEPNTDELRELRELECMFEKWGYEPHKLEHDINGVYSIHTPPIIPDNEHESALVDNGTVNCPDYPTPNPRHLPDEPAPVTPNYTDLDTLRRDYDNGIPTAIAYMRDLQEYTEECLREQEEWEAEEQTRYALEHPQTPPAEGPAPAAPHDGKHDDECDAHTLVHVDYHTVELPNHKPQANARDMAEPPTHNHPTARPTTRLPPPPWPNNNYITPYSTPRSRPPPWPNKKPNRNRGWHGYGKSPIARYITQQRPPPWPNKRRCHTPYYTTIATRPPPWPNKHSDIPTILPITNLHPPPWPNQRRHRYKSIWSTPRSRPPPWPIISRHTTQAFQNRRNAKRRLKAKSRIISDIDKVSV